MFSIYTSAFNLERGEFDYRTLQRFADFVGESGEVVVALNKSSDGSESTLKQFTSQFPNVRIIDCDVSYSDPDMDGKIKNAALQETTRPFKIGLDLDEHIPLWQRPLWENMARALEQTPVKALFIPSVDLYSSADRVSAIGQKWYLHKAGCFRGTVNFARREDGTHDVTRSDSCELIDTEGNLVMAYSVSPNFQDLDSRIKFLESGEAPFVVHTGYLDLERRARLHKSFWLKHWAIENGAEIYIPTELKEFTKQTSTHKLRIE